jgi:hypothetical protein
VIWFPRESGGTKQFTKFSEINTTHFDYTVQVNGGVTTDLCSSSLEYRRDSGPGSKVKRTTKQEIQKHVEMNAFFILTFITVKFLTYLHIKPSSLM